MSGGREEGVQACLKHYLAQPHHNSCTTICWERASLSQEGWVHWDREGVQQPAILQSLLGTTRSTKRRGHFQTVASTFWFLPNLPP